MSLPPEILAKDFHVLRSEEVQIVIDAADRVKYRAPKNANGSRGRYFHAKCVREAARAAKLTAKAGETTSARTRESTP